MVHLVAGQFSLSTTKSGRFGNDEVGEYRTRITESEHTCTFKVYKRRDARCSSVHWLPSGNQNSS